MAANAYFRPARHGLGNVSAQASADVSVQAAINASTTDPNATLQATTGVNVSALGSAQLSKLQQLTGVNVAGLSATGQADLGKLTSGQIDSLSPAAKAQILQTTGINVDTMSADTKVKLAQFQTDLRVAQGIVAVAALSSGINLNDPNGQAALLGAISAGLAVIVPVGTVCAGAIQALYAVGKAAACPVTNFFADVFGIPHDVACGGQACTTSGNWTPDVIVQGSQLPPHQAGSFADLAIAAIAYNAAQWGNCKGVIQADQIMTAIVNVWNAAHQGPSEMYFIPPLTGGLASPIIPYWANTTGKDPNGNTGDPNVTYAWGPLSATYWKDPKFQPPLPSFYTSISPGSGYGGGSVYFPAYTAAVNTGPLVGTVVSATATKVATAVVAAPAALALGTIVYAYATGRTVDTVFRHLWSGARMFWEHVTREAGVKKNPISLIRERHRNPLRLIKKRHRR